MGLCSRRTIYEILASTFAVVYVFGALVLTVTSPIYQDHLPTWARWTLLGLFGPFYVFVLANTSSVAAAMLRRWLMRANRST